MKALLKKQNGSFKVVAVKQLEKEDLRFFGLIDESSLHWVKKWNGTIETLNQKKYEIGNKSKSKNYDLLLQIKEKIEKKLDQVIL